MIKENVIEKFKIGICDDEDIYRKELFDICYKYFEDKDMDYTCTLFTDGEEVVDFCNSDEDGIDLLFLDVEMNRIDGMTLKDMVLRNEKIQKICFVSSHLEVVLDAFSIKTMGFVEKPISQERIFRVLAASIEEIHNNYHLEFDDLNGNNVAVELDDIIYMKAKGSYTYIYEKGSREGESKEYIIVKKLGDIEKMFSDASIVRVHKSYLVNLEYVKKFGSQIELRQIDEVLPVGRVYAKKAKEKYYDFGKKKVLNRI